MNKEELSKIYAKRVSDHVSDYIKVCWLDFEYENKPMIEKERRKYRNSFDKYRDNFMFDIEIFQNFLGNTIYQAYSNAFKTLFNGGKMQACKENAMRMKAKGYGTEDIADITGLTSEQINSL